MVKGLPSCDTAEISELLLWFTFRYGIFFLLKTFDKPDMFTLAWIPLAKSLRFLPASRACTHKHLFSRFSVFSPRVVYCLPYLSWELQEGDGSTPHPQLNWDFLPLLFPVVRWSKYCGCSFCLSWAQGTCKNSHCPWCFGFFSLLYGRIYLSVCTER